MATVKNICKTICDICGKSVLYYTTDSSESTWLEKPTNIQIKAWPKMTLPIKFLTEQDEGTACKPYFDKATIDICPECYQKLLDIWPVIGRGAQGYNNYTIEKNT